MERLQRVVGSGERDGHGHGHGDPRAGLEALCRGAGLELAALPHDGAAAMLQLAGRLLREAIVGLKDVDLKQNEQAHRLGLAALRSDAEDPPFRWTTPADDLLVQMLSHAQPQARCRTVAAAEFRPGEAARGRPRCRRQRRACRTDALFEPRDLEERFERSSKRNLMGARPSNWELFKELHRTLAESPGEHGMPHVAAEQFAAAYETAIKPPPKD